MKKLLLFAILVISSIAARAQVGSVVLNNANNVCDVKYTLHARCPSIGANHCQFDISAIIYVSAFSTVSFTDPLNVESTVGWSAFTPSGGGLGGVVPSDFEWTFIGVDYVGCTGPPTCNTWGTNVGTGCLGYPYSKTTPLVAPPPSGVWCGGTGVHSAAWTPTSTAPLTNITVTTN